MLVDGDWLGVFFKDLNPFHQLVDARAIRETTLERSRRELHVYRNVLQGGFLGTPTLYGSRWEPAKGLLWLFLEDVGPKRLSRIGDFSLWAAAARWTARFHTAARSLPTEVLAPLPRLEVTNYEHCADQLEARLGRFPAENHGTIRSALKLYRNVIHELARQSPADSSTTNSLAKTSSSGRPPRPNALP